MTDLTKIIKETVKDIVADCREMKGAYTVKEVEESVSSRILQLIKEVTGEIINVGEKDEDGDPKFWLREEQREKLKKLLDFRRDFEG